MATYNCRSLICWSQFCLLRCLERGQRGSYLPFFQGLGFHGLLFHRVNVVEGFQVNFVQQSLLLPTLLEEVSPCLNLIAEFFLEELLLLFFKSTFLAQHLVGVLGPEMGLVELLVYEFVKTFLFSALFDLHLQIV